VGWGPYVRFGRSVQTTRDVGALGSADAAGAHTRSLLAEIGYDDATVDELIGRGVVGSPQVPA
jgi:hypothetical protein